jgi:hypothetical protein
VYHGGTGGDHSSPLTPLTRTEGEGRHTQR